MGVTETNLGSRKKFQSGSLILIGETNLETNKATLKSQDGKLFTVPEADEATITAYEEIFLAYKTWVATE